MVGFDLKPLLQGQMRTAKPKICLFGVLRRFQHCTGHITTGSWKGRGIQYIQFARVLYCKLPTNGKQLPAFPHKALTGIEPRPQRWEARVLPLCHRGPPPNLKVLITRLLLVLEVWDGKPAYRKSWAGNLLVWSDLTLGPSFKVK